MRLRAEPRQHKTQNQLGITLHRYIVSLALLYYNQIALRQPAPEGWLIGDRSAIRGEVCIPS